MDPPRLAGLDSLRGVAICSVLLFHLFIVRPFAGPWWIGWIGQGAQGVGLFFMLSALTLALSWHHRSAGEPHPVQAFWARRFWRIAPLYYVILAAAFMLPQQMPQYLPPSFHEDPFTWANLAAHLTFVFGMIPAFQNSWIGVEWSIGVEMVFYGLFPWIMGRLMPKWGTGKILAAGVVLAMVWPAVLQWAVHPWPSWAKGYLLWSFPTQFLWFGAGLWIWSHAHVRPRQAWWVVAWLGMATLIASHPWMPLMGNVVWVIPNLLLVWMAWHDLGALRWLTHNRILRYIGQRSYSLYLVHWLVINNVVLTIGPWTNQANLSGFFARLAVGLPVSVAVSEITYRWVEQPALKYGKQWVRRHLNRSPQAVAAPLSSLQLRR